MRKYVLKRVLLVLLTAFIILSLTFIMMKFLPFQEPVGQANDKLRYYNDQFVQGFVLRFKVLFDANEYPSLGVHYIYYQRPIMEQYFSWLINIVTKWD